MRIRLYIDPETGDPHLFRHAVSARAAAAAQEQAMTEPHYPPGWDQERVRKVLEHYESQSDDEAVAEDEAAYEAPTHTTMEVPVELVPAIRELIARRRTA